MNVIKNRDLEKEEKKLKEGFYGTGIQFYREGDGIDTPIKMIIGFPSIRGDPDEVERISKLLMAAKISLAHNLYLLKKWTRAHQRGSGRSSQDT